ncbi:MAG: argininosuccinate lyase [Desulfobacterales bacterium]|nr:argininosuccinate lyase [Desulfobacterales bacterium]
MSDKPWSGRFSEDTNKLVEAFTASIDIDKRLYSYDIAGSIAHAKMLSKNSIITAEESELLVHGLEEIKKEIEEGVFTFKISLEDIHMHIESRLFEKIGKTAHKLHTARSRNDQVALDVRMYLREETKNISYLLIALRKIFVDLANKYIDVILPGYTHLQRAQVILFSHYLMAYYEMFTRDYVRIKESLKRTNVMPLGSAALAGTTYPIDRKYTASLLNFPEISANSIDAVSDRDFIIEFISIASMTMVHLSRISEELILWSSSEFKFIDLPDAFATGSSIMPQKKNPDVAELVRGKSGRVFGNLMAILTIMKSLPLAYNRDMQEDKNTLFDTVDTLKGCLEVYIAMLPNIKVNKEKMFNATEKGYLNATDLADYLVCKGMPFREAHGCVGKAVSYGIDKNKELNELSFEELKAFSNLIEEDIFNILTAEEMINRRKTFGATSKQNVISSIKEAYRQIEKDF